MHGNVWEWCWDCFSLSYYYYSSSPAQDPTGAVSGYDRVVRGGSWINLGQYLRSAYRGVIGPGNGIDSLGFRLVCPAQ
jgi:formylglycine-generating enzyme required for sulfatase activity